jgi:hypothetical protein
MVNIQKYLNQQYLPVDLTFGYCSQQELIDIILPEL